MKTKLSNYKMQTHNLLMKWEKKRKTFEAEKKGTKEWN